MADVLERLRNLAGANKERIEKAKEIAEKMIKTAEEAQKSGQSAKK